MKMVYCGSKSKVSLEAGFTPQFDVKELVQKQLQKRILQKTINYSKNNRYHEGSNMFHISHYLNRSCHKN